MESASNGWRSTGGGRPRRAHTLVEVLLVLTILSMFALIAIPKMASAVLRSRLDAGIEALRNDLSYTRALAVGTGLRHQFELDPDSGQVAVQPFRPEEQSTLGAGQPAQIDVVLHDRLHSDVRVVTWTVAPMAGAEQQAAPAAAAATLPLVFYPEGRSDGAVLILEDTEGTRRGLTVDPLTGEIRELLPEELQQ